MDPIKTTAANYLFSILDWYTHYRHMDSHELSLKRAKEKAASMWSCSIRESVEGIADYLTMKIDDLVGGVENEA